MTDSLKGKGQCNIHGPYIWKYINGTCVTEHLRKEPESSNINSKSKKRPDLDKLTNKFLGAS